ncbi:MAG: ATP phosphoribosyltransferase [Patescibacteria group bacterium]|nr:ATP phosphoribosyltransferase [Patescibacteria group bacterium]
MYKIAIQKKGRLTEQSLKYLRSIGIKVPKNGREMIARSDDLEILFLRQTDIPEFVEKGIVDFGIVGENAVAEKRYKVRVVEKLGFARCSLKIVVPRESSAKSVKDLNGERIATSFPNLLKDFLKKNKVNASIIEVKGSVEVTPAMGLTDAVCDLVQTGKTLEENNLVPLVTVLESQAVLISNPNSKWPF